MNEDIIKCQQLLSKSNRVMSDIDVLLVFSILKLSTISMYYIISTKNMSFIFYIFTTDIVSVI